MVAEECQVVVCENCGSKWRIAYDDGVVVAGLVECPLCERLKEASC